MARSAIITAGIYQVIADIVRRIPDEATRKLVADHFATEFNRRSASFDPYTWGRWTGGRPAPNSAYGGMPRAERP
jgi:hypothetical protein